MSATPLFLSPRVIGVNSFHPLHVQGVVTVGGVGFSECNEVRRGEFEEGNKVVEKIPAMENNKAVAVRGDIDEGLISCT